MRSNRPCFKAQVVNVQNTVVEVIERHVKSWSYFKGGFLKLICELTSQARPVNFSKVSATEHSRCKVNTCSGLDMTRFNISWYCTYHSNNECGTYNGRVTHICVSKLTIIGSENGLSPGRHQAIIWTNAGILLIRTLGTNFSEILGKIHSFSFKKMHLKMSSAKGRLFSLGLNVLNTASHDYLLSVF